MAERQFSNEQWAVALELFGQLAESLEPDEFIASQDDQVIREALENLWRGHRRAEKQRFLEEQITLISELSAGGPAVFHSSQILSGRFAILRMLGRGGMGEVYLAEDRRLMETVALKTIKRELAKDQDNRDRFLAEVQNSRRVTHPNVCRIFDLFEHEEVPFYSMEYVAGPTLAEVLKAGPMKDDRARQIAGQTAAALSAAHSSGVLHCDFKPANVILAGSGKYERAVITDFGLALAVSGIGPTSTASARGGTPFYMAPEVKAGAAPSVKSDIFAFGRVLDELVPGHKLVANCCSRDPGARPSSMEDVLRELKGTIGRRRWLELTAIVLSLGGGSAYLQSRWQPKVPLGSRQRVHVNGFAPNDVQNVQALRALIIIALRQSPLLNVVGDRGYLAADGATIRKAGFSFPLAQLLKTARAEKSNLVIDGQFEETSRGAKLRVSVYDVAEQREAYRTEVEVEDKRQLVRLSELAATNLRREAFGESAFYSSYRPLERIVSTSPAAVDLYFRAIYRYEQEDSQAALTLLDQALAIDSNFVLAHHYKAVALSSIEMLEDAQVSAEKAFSMRDQVTERERNWIASQYYNIVRAWTESAAALARNTVLFPEEAVFERQLAFALMRLGQYDDAIAHNRRAVEIDPFGQSNLSQLLTNLGEAGRTSECFKQVEAFRVSGKTPNFAQFGLALAHLQLSNYAEAYRQFKLIGETNSANRSYSRAYTPVPLIMLGRFDEAITILEEDLALDLANPPGEREQSLSYKRYSSLGQLKLLKDLRGEALEQAEALVSAKPLACNLIPLREGALLAVELQDLRLAQLALDKISAIAIRWPSAHCQGAVWLTRAVIGDLQNETEAAALFAKAKGAWADPLNLFSVSRWQGKSEMLEAQLASLKELDRMRGKIFKHHFTGLAVLGWLEQARCLEKMALFTDSFRLYKRVAEHWANPQASGSLVQQLLREKEAVRRRIE